MGDNFTQSPTCTTKLRRGKGLDPCPSPSNYPKHGGKEFLTDAKGVYEVCWRCLLAAENHFLYEAAKDCPNHAVGCEKGIAMDDNMPRLRPAPPPDPPSMPPTPPPDTTKTATATTTEDALKPKFTRRGSDLLMDLDMTCLNMSFGGCGFMGIYHVGVAAAFRTFLPMAHFGTLAGCSAGALAAVCLLGDINPTLMASKLMHAAVEARTYVLGPWNPSYRVTDILRSNLREILPENIHLICNGRLYLSTTDIQSGANTAFYTYQSKEDLIEVCLASAFIPGFSGTKLLRLRGRKVMDGGFSKNIYEVGPDTITVLPFAGDAHISPYDDKKAHLDVHRFHFANQGIDLSYPNLLRFGNVFFPPKAIKMAGILEQGFRDAHRFLRRQGLTNCHSCVIVRSSLDKKCVSDVKCEEFAKLTNLPADFHPIISSSIEMCRNPDKIKRSPENLAPPPSHYSILMKIRDVMFATPLGFLAQACWWSTLYTTRRVGKYAAHLAHYIDDYTDSDVVEYVEASIAALLKKVGENSVEVIPATERGGPSRMRNRYRRRVDIQVHEFEPFAAAEGPADNVSVDEVDGVHMTKSDHLDQDEKVVLHMEYEATEEEDVDEDQMNRGLNTRAEADQLLSDNLVAMSLSSADPSRVTSRVASRVASLAASRINSKAGSTASSRRGSFGSAADLASVASTNETLTNIMRLTENQEAAMALYYEDENGEQVTWNLYDIADPVDLVGDDLVHSHSHSGKRGQTSRQSMTAEDAFSLRRTRRKRTNSAPDPDEVEYRLRRHMRQQQDQEQTNE